jgi:ribose 1,5-bisphosphokinase PhnN
LVTYETSNKEKISLIVASSDSAVVAGGEEVRAGSLTFHYRDRSGLKVITWTAHGLSYALVSNVAGSARASCLVCHQNMTDHSTFHTGS